MGSLMAGWDSPTSKANYSRQKSNTKNEIESYWKSKQTHENEHLVEATEIAKQLQMQKQPTSHENMSNEGIREEMGEHHHIVEKQVKVSVAKDWWTRSTSAFLNDAQMNTKEVAQNRSPKFGFLATSVGYSPRVSPRCDTSVAADKT